MKSLIMYSVGFVVLSSALIGDWQSYNISSILDDNPFKNILNLALGSFLQEIGKEFFSNCDWHITKVHTIEGQLVNGINYRVKVNIENSEGQQHIVTWIINYQPEKNESTLLSWEIENSYFENIDHQEKALMFRNNNFEGKSLKIPVFFK